MNSRPRIMVNVLIFNSEGNKILVGKKYDENNWSCLNGKLCYGECFEDCVARILSNTLNILVEDKDRLKFVCTYNAMDKVTNNHMVCINYQIQITKEEEKFYLMVDPYYYQYWNWLSYEEFQKMSENLTGAIQIFLKKFNIKSFNDMKNLISN